MPNLKELIFLVMKPVGVDSTEVSLEQFAYREANSKIDSFGQLAEAEISSQIFQFFITIGASLSALKKEEIMAFKNGLESLPPQVHDVVVSLLHQVMMDTYQQFYRDPINQLIEKIENPKGIIEAKNDEINLNGLFNLYCLTEGKLLPFKVEKNGFRLKEGDKHQEAIIYDIPFGINALMLQKQIPVGYQYCGLTFRAPLYPELSGAVNAGAPFESKSLPGMLESAAFYPYQRVSKQHKGDVGDHTFKATDGVQLLYVRGISDYKPGAVLASLMATYVSSDHFSSEVLLDNHLVASVAYSPYAVSIIDDTEDDEENSANDARKKHIKEGHVFSGTGVINEVLNFVQESDPNQDNYGFSSKAIINPKLAKEELMKIRLVKIDFDKCDLVTSIDEEQYEQDRLTKPYGKVYHDSEKVEKDADYIQEKLRARLKLSLLSDELIVVFSKRVYGEEKEREIALQEIKNRRAIALTLFCKHPKVAQFLQNNKESQLLEELVVESKQFIAKHFRGDEAEELTRSIDRRKAEIHAQLQPFFKIENEQLEKEKFRLEQEKREKEQQELERQAHEIEKKIEDQKKQEGGKSAALNAIAGKKSKYACKELGENINGLQADLDDLDKIIKEMKDVISFGDEVIADLGDINKMLDEMEPASAGFREAKWGVQVSLSPSSSALVSPPAADSLGRPASAASDDAASANGSTAVQPGCSARQAPPSSGSSSSMTSSMEDPIGFGGGIQLQPNSVGQVVPENKPVENKHIGLCVGMTAGLILLAACMANPLVALCMLKLFLSSTAVNAVSVTVVTGAKVGSVGFFATSALGGISDKIYYAARVSPRA